MYEVLMQQSNYREHLMNSEFGGLFRDTQFSI